eukprot:TRINITY_DN3599_c0_g1_i1.p3 TRINITY_DN3599_c0_g1~~TRINITY_DN3599_c0_g1_i1.p3  ORF type:complete len:111 (-),score=16.72 TRINITY_DN3599_c0_g1_i1:854-1186(-)
MIDISEEDEDEEDLHILAEYMETGGMALAIPCWFNKGIPFQVMLQALKTCLLDRGFFAANLASIIISMVEEEENQDKNKSIVEFTQQKDLDTFRAVGTLQFELSMWWISV